jgi:hypothetical protein
MRSWTHKLAVLVLGVVALCVPAIAKADSITPQQMGADLAIVNTDIAENFQAFMQSSLAQTDYAAGFVTMTEGLLDFAEGQLNEAQSDFLGAINYFDGTLAALNLPALPGGSDPVPEPSSVLLLGIGATLTTLVARAKHRQGRALKIASPAAA